LYLQIKGFFMAAFASVKTRPKKETKPCVGTVLHNQRITKPSYLLPEQFRLDNYHSNIVKNATKTFNDWSLENETRYAKINKRKLRSDAHRLESLLVVLSEEQVAKCDPDQIWQKAEEFKLWFEQKYKTKVRTMDWHRDEGHVNIIPVYNHHIHLEFDNVNTEGKMVRKLFSKGDLKKFQDKIFEIYKPLGFERGISSNKKGVNQRDWRPQKVAEELQDFLKLSGADYTKNKKIQDDLEQKNLDLQVANNRQLAKMQDVKNANLQLRKQLQEAGGNRVDYAKLEEQIKELKAQAKNKDLTIAELTAAVAKLEHTLGSTKQERNEFEDELITAEATIKSGKAEFLTHVLKTEKLDDEVAGLQAELALGIHTPVKADTIKIDKLEAENSTLKAQNKALKGELAQKPNESMSSELEELTSDFKCLQSDFKNLKNKMDLILNNVGKFLGLNVEHIKRLFTRGAVQKWECPNLTNGSAATYQPKP
jgi:FtsZ-binding cell division protein ZapB